MKKYNIIVYRTISKWKTSIVASSLKKALEKAEELAPRKFTEFELPDGAFKAVEDNSKK